MSTGKRLTQYVEKQGFTKKEFCSDFDFEYNNLVSVMADKRALGINILNKLHESLPKLNIHWLLYGEGPLEVDAVSFNYVNEGEEEYELQNNSFNKLLLKCLENEKVKEKILAIINDANEND